MIGAGDVLEEHRDINDAEIVSTKGANANDAEVRIPHHDGIACAPFVAGEEPGVDEVDIALKGRLEVVLPAQQCAENRDVLGLEGVFTGAEGVDVLTQIDELSFLRFANQELGSVLDLLVLIRKTPTEGVARVVFPLDDLQELCLEVVDDAHGACFFVWRRFLSRNRDWKRIYEGARTRNGNLSPYFQ